MKALTLAFAACGIVLLSSFIYPPSVKVTDPSPEGVDMKVQYRIQLASYQDEVPVADKELFNSIEGLTSLKSNGKMVFLTAPFQSEEEATKELPLIRQQGFKNAMKVVLLDGRVIGARTYHLFYDNKKCSEADKTKLFKTEYRVLD